MGEYAKFKGELVKIGTCEEMYYLRADQAHLIQKVPNSIDPVQCAPQIRFRFPFPDEDQLTPGQFEDPFRTLGLHGLAVPAGVEHEMMQWTSVRRGYLVLLPCPESEAGRKNELRFTKSAFGGEVRICQQRLVDGKLVLVCECGGCGAKYHLPTLEDAAPILSALEALAESDDFGKDEARAKYHREVAARIVGGYTQPNPWTTSEPIERAA